MANGQWEVVGSKAKKKSKVPVKSPKGGKNQEKEANNHLAGAALTESTNLYVEFLKKKALESEASEQKEQQAKEKKLNSEQSKQQPQKNVQKKKKPDKKANPTKISFEEAFALVSIDEMKGHLLTLDNLCPDNPLLYLKEIASFLSVKLDVSSEDPVFPSKPIGYPVSLLHKNVYKEIMSVLKKATPQILNVFYEFSLAALVQDMLKGVPGNGYRCMLQCVAQEFPSVVKECLPKCLELCNNHLNRPPICLSIMWAAGQAGNKNLDIGFKVWTDLMFPLIGLKNCVAYIVEYVDKLIERSEGKCTKSLIGIQDYFNILDLVHSKDFTKGPVQKKMFTLFPTIKTLSYGPQPQNVLCTYFPSYLIRLDSQCPAFLKEELLSSLVHCLGLDPRCYSIWRQLYSKHFDQSKLLVAYINSHHDKLSSKFPRSLLLETLSVFQVTNEEFAANRKKNPDIQEFIKVTQQLLNKLRKSQSNSRKWLMTFFLISIVALLGVVRYDVVVHGSFAKSKTGRWMREYGILAALHQASEKFNIFYVEANKLLSKYMPTVAAWCQKTLAPALESFLSALGATLLSAWQSTEWLREVCAKNMPVLLQKVENAFGEYYPKVTSVVHSGIITVSSQLATGSAFVVKQANTAVSSLQSSPQLMDLVAALQRNCGALAGYIQKHAASLLAIVQSYIPT